MAAKEKVKKTVKVVKKEASSNKWAVIAFKGAQHLVREGEEVLFPHLSENEEDPKVLLFVENEDVQIGIPSLDKIKIKYEIVEELAKGEKIHVKKYKSKSRYRKHIGHRPQFTKVLIKSISK